jgi:hypothetical protein
MTLLRASGVVLLALSAAACSELPGEVLGTYKVTMTLEENSCGATAVHSLDKKRYAVQVRSEAAHAYWRIPGQPPIQGSYEAPDFAFEFRAVVAHSGPDAGPMGCRLTQRDRVTGSVLFGDEDAQDAGTKDAGEGVDADTDQEGDDEDKGAAGTLDAGLDTSTGLVGEHVMTIEAEPGTDCGREALMPAGPFQRLPCSVRYKLVGVPTKPF